MEPTYWHKQTDDKPLFDSLLWSRPENKLHAGKLLVIGGNEHAFAVPAEAYQEAVKAGAGVVKVLLPDRLQRTVGAILENGEFAPSNKSGSFAQNALAEWLSHATWADAVLLAGDLGRNSETAIVLESFVNKYGGQITITKDALDYFKDVPALLLERPSTTLILTIAQLQKLCTAAKFITPIKFSMTLAQLIEALHQLTTLYPANIITNHNDVYCVASSGQVSTTARSTPEKWRTKTAACAAVWWMQNPHKTFEALTTSIVAK